MKNASKIAYALKHASSMDLEREAWEAFTVVKGPIYPLCTIYCMDLCNVVEKPEVTHRKALR